MEHGAKLSISFESRKNMSYLYWIGLFLTVSSVSSCFITDCPHGIGKRSLSKGINMLPQCPTCGPTHLQTGPDPFRCYGPNLCCSPSMGCLSGNLPGVRVCALEDLNLSPCENHVKHCHTAGQGGQCVYKGVCCNPKGQCSNDDTCNQHPLNILTVERFVNELENSINEFAKQEEN